MTHKVFPEMRRRNFLAYGSSGALSLAFAASGAKAWPRAANALATERISVGYLPGSAKLARVEQVNATPGASIADTEMAVSNSTSAPFPWHAHLIAAKDLPEGDPHFIHTGVRLSIHGLFPSDAFKMYPDLRLWAIDVEFNAARSKPLFCAWCVQNEMVPQSDACISFAMPIVDTLNLRLSTKHTPRHQSVTLASASNSTTDSQQVWLPFSLGRETNVPKLQRGIYVVALPNARTGRLPNWHDYELRATDSEGVSAMTELHRRDRRRQAGFDDFAYVKLTVDYADHLAITQV